MFSIKHSDRKIWNACVGFYNLQPWRENMQEKGERLVIYYDESTVNPTVFVFQGSLDQFLELSEIEPYGETLNSRENPREARVEVKRRDTNRTIMVVAQEIERERVSISHIFEPGLQILTAKRID